MEYLAIFFELLKLLLIFSAAAATIIVIIGLFHPLTFNVKLRASMLGQRAEIWFSYLFGIFKIGVIATPNIQDVTLKIFFWKKRLKRNQRPRPERPAPPPSSEAPPQKPVEKGMPVEAPTAEESKVTATAAEQPLSAQQQPASKSDEPLSPAMVEDKTVTDLPPAISSAESNREAREKPVAQGLDATIDAISPGPEGFVQSDAATRSPADNSAQVKISSAKTQKTDETEAAETIEPVETTEAAEPVKASPAKVLTPPSAENIDTTPLKPIDQVAEEQKKAEIPPQAGPQQPGNDAKLPGAENWRARMRRFRRDLSRRYRELKGHIRLFMRKWKILSPIMWRFWARGKKGFSLSEPSLMVRYALHEPYITGMLHGSLSILSGMVGRFGINFMPVPVFSDPCIYARGRVTAIIRPWRFMAAMLGLLLERDLYREAWQAFRWYRARRQQA